MDSKMHLVLMAAVVLTSACATTDLWLGGEKDQYVRFIPEQPGQDVEAALAGSGKQYRCTTTSDAASKNSKVCFTKLSEAEKNTDMKVKFLQTPDAVQTDLGDTIRFVGYVVVQMTLGNGGDCKPKPYGNTNFQRQDCNDHIWAGDENNKPEARPR